MRAFDDPQGFKTADVVGPIETVMFPTEKVREACEMLMLEATERARSGHGHPVSGSCAACDGLMVFVEYPKEVEFVGCVSLRRCDRHATAHRAIRSAYNERAIRWH